MGATQKDSTLWTYDDERDGQIAVGTVASPWMKTTGFTEILLMGAFAGGTTQVFVDQANAVTGSGSTASPYTNASPDYTSADQFASLAAGAKVNIAYAWCRVRIVQAAATTTNAELAAAASD